MENGECVEMKVPVDKDLPSYMNPCGPGDHDVQDQSGVNKKTVDSMKRTQQSYSFASKTKMPYFKAFDLVSKNLSTF